MNRAGACTLWDRLSRVFGQNQKSSLSQVAISFLKQRESDCFRRGCVQSDENDH